MSHALASRLDGVGSAGSDLTCAGFCRFYNYPNSNRFTLISPTPSRCIV